MKCFIGYFILEFAIIFLVAYGINIFFVQGAMSIGSMVASAATSGAIIAYALVKTHGTKTCWWKKSGGGK